MAAPTRRPGSARSSGFTLAELVIVMLVIGIVAAVAVPRAADAISYYRVDAAAKRIAADLEMARRTAKTSAAEQSVKLDPSTGVYSFPDIDNPDHPGQAYVVALSATGYPATLVSADFSGAAELKFDIHGRPDNGGTIVVQSGRHRKTIAVDASTGKAKVQ